MISFFFCTSQLQLADELLSAPVYLTAAMAPWRANTDEKCAEQPAENASSEKRIEPSTTQSPLAKSNEGTHNDTNLSEKMAGANENDNSPFAESALSPRKAQPPTSYASIPQHLAEQTAGLCEKNGWLIERVLRVCRNGKTSCGERGTVAFDERVRWICPLCD